MTPEVHTIIIAIITALTSSGAMSLIIYLIQRNDKRKEREEEKNSAQSKMLLGLGYDRIINLTDKFVRRGAITLKEKRNLEFLCKPYFDLGGNGDVNIGYEACTKLKVVSEEEALEMDVDATRKEYGWG